MTLNRPDLMSLDSTNGERPTRERKCVFCARFAREGRMVSAMWTPDPRLVSLAAVMAILDKHEVAPDGYYHAHLHERIVGWHSAVARVRAGIEALADEETDE